jgi:hypothetical protein
LRNGDAVDAGGIRKEQEPYPRRAFFLTRRGMKPGEKKEETSWISMTSAQCKRLGIKKAILVTDEGLVKARVIKEVIATLEGTRGPYAVYDKGEEDLSMKTVHKRESSSGGRMQGRHHFG